MTRRAVQVRVTNDALTHLLNLPAGQRVTGVFPLSNADILHGTARLLIEGDDLPVVPEGVDPPFATVMMESHTVYRATKVVP